MTYNLSGKIEASDYNTLSAQINTVFGTGTGDSGYGGDSTNVGVSDLPTITVGDVIQTATDVLNAGSPPGDPDEWVNLRNAFEDCATHQSTVLTNVLPSISLLEDGDLVAFFATLNSPTNSTDLTTNRNTHTGESFSVATKLTSVRSTPWSIMLRHEFTVDFGTENNARHYFNTGGDLRISATRTGGTVAAPNPLLPGASASVQNAAWTLLLNSNSPYIFTSSDYFNLTTGYLPKQNVSDPGTYANNNWIIRVKADSIPGVLGGKGSLIRFQSDFNDSHTNSGGFGIEDFVDGTFTSTLDESRAIGIFNKTTMTITYSTVVALTAGT